jgi:hypothetical protein
MEKGFYHPSRGYWQTTDDVPAVIITTYPPGTVETPLQPSAGFAWDGHSWQAAPPVPLTLDDFRLAIDAHVEATAQHWGYNSAAHIAGYVASTVPIWSAEALAFVAWRDLVWQQAIGQLALIEAGQITPPASPAALIAILPAAVRPKGGA